MEQEQVTQRQDRPEFLAWVKSLQERTANPQEDDEGGRTWVRLGDQ